MRKQSEKSMTLSTCSRLPWDELSGGGGAVSLGNVAAWQSAKFRCVGTDPPASIGLAS